MSIVDLGPGAQQLANLIARVGDDELGKPTPCPSYTLGDLIEHVGGLALAFTAAANKDSGRYVEGAPSGDASRLGEDWRVRISRDLAALAEAWRKPAAWAGTTRIAGMDAPAGMVGLSAADELVVHGWDVARATRQPYACEPELLAAAGELPRPVRQPRRTGWPGCGFRAVPAGARRRAGARSRGRAGRARPRMVTRLTGADRRPADGGGWPPG
jgi:uncharacterized protein (TIGR03086 family)